MYGFNATVNYRISIHVPTKGTTHTPLTTYGALCYFNPRTHEGYDNCADAFFRDIGNFNPRTHKGDASTSRGSPSISLVFQSTYPRRVRQYLKGDGWVYENFNPRTHEGYDHKLFALSNTLRHFNPRTHEGYDTDIYEKYDGSLISIHVPTKGTTVYLLSHGTPL